MTTPSEAYALEMVQACTSKRGISFPKDANFTYTATEQVGEYICQGTLSITLSNVGEADIQFDVEYNLLGPGDGKTWDTGQCAIVIDGDREFPWIFYAQRDSNKNLSTKTLVLNRTSRALQNAVSRLLQDFESAPQTICRWLQGNAYKPTLEGLLQYVSETFALVDVRVIQPTKPGLPPEIYGHRANNPMIKIEVPSRVIAFLLTHR